MKKETQSGIFRMFHFLLISAALYAAAMLVDKPQLQIILWKSGHIVNAAFIGYWVDRATSRDKIDATSSGLMYIRRAIIIAAAMLSVSMGL